MKRDQLLRKSLHRLGVERRPAVIDPDVAALQPSELLQPLSERRDEDASIRAFVSSESIVETLIRQPPCGCCARAASGHAAAAPPSNVMNSRRLMGRTSRLRN